jgi:3-methyl-2-oxobutanoate hydroxymethyltransferase
MSSPSSQRALSIRDLRAKKAAGQPISMLTAYDASFGARVDATGIDSILVGDSLGNVVLGHDSTLPVTVDDMVHHVAAVRRGVSRALLIADMPFLSYATPDRALDAAHRLLGEGGASMVKLEGGGPVVDAVAALTASGVAVCAHLGLTPQHVHRLGGYRFQARDADGREALAQAARALQDAGASLLVLECVPESVAGELAAELDMPVIGIGAGRHVDGQVLVLYDVLGITPGHRPGFSEDFLSGRDSIQAALQAYVDDVHAGRFPDERHVLAD